MAEQHASTIWLTQDAYDQLVAELDFLKGEGRATVSAKIAQARDEGDLSENGGYHAAREEQAHQEVRIRQLSETLEHAQVGEAPDHSNDEVLPGVEVTVAFDDDPDDTDTFLLGSRELLNLADGVDTQVYSPQSPLGTAILGKKAGEKASYDAPNGKPIEVTILAVKPFLG